MPLSTLVTATGIGSDAATFDVVAGASRLADCLLGQRILPITVLDLSDRALATAPARLPEAASVSWVAVTVLHWRPSRRFHAWHDRAAFHFLTENADQDACLRGKDRAFLPGGFANLGTFTADGRHRAATPRRSWRTIARRALLQRSRNRPAGAGSSLNQPEIRSGDGE